jgi:hypothetical protein
MKSVTRRLVSAGLVLAVCMSGMAPYSSAAPGAERREQIDRKRLPNGDTLMAYIHRDSLADPATGCFDADGYGATRWAPQSPIKFVITYTPVVTHTTWSVGETLSASLSPLGGQVGVSATVTVTWGKNILVQDTFTEQTSGSATFAGINGRFCPAIATNKVWMRGAATTRARGTNSSFTTFTAMTSLE